MEHVNQSTGLVIQEQSKDLSIKFSETAIESMKAQSAQLKAFVQSQMHKDVDYGIIDGTKKPSLFKPGAEKLRKIFQLGTRIIDHEVIRENEPPFVMYKYTVEVFHIPTSKGIAQCEGSANSDEKKYKKVAIGDLHNTLMKMAQKRAEVGATINAVNASDLFTQDVEDLKGTGLIANQENVNPEAIDWDNHVLSYGRVKGKQIKDCSRRELQGFVDWTVTAKVTAPKVLEQRDVIIFFLKEVFSNDDPPVPKFDEDEEIPF